VRFRDLESDQNVNGVANRARNFECLLKLLLVELLPVGRAGLLPDIYERWLSEETLLAERANRVRRKFGTGHVNPNLEVADRALKGLQVESIRMHRPATWIVSGPPFTGLAPAICTIVERRRLVAVHAPAATLGPIDDLELEGEHILYEWTRDVRQSRPDLPPPISADEQYALIGWARRSLAEIRSVEIIPPDPGTRSDVPVQL
jgi:hypothetical protein